METATLTLAEVYDGLTAPFPPHVIELKPGAVTKDKTKALALAYADPRAYEDREGLRIVEEVNNGKRIIPTLFFADGSTLVEPSNPDLAAKLGLRTRPDCPFYDLGKRE